MAKPKKSKGLGRGLSALMNDIAPTETAAPTQVADVPVRPTESVPIEKVSPNPDQPRRTFNKEDLDELANSVRIKGIIQPLIVRPDPKSAGNFQIVAGERRWRAAQLAQLHEVPIVVRELDDIEVLEIAIIENIQRADLNPIDEAAGYQQLIDRFQHTQEALSNALSKSRSYIANSLRLLNLPKEVQDFVVGGHLSAGHARTLVAANDPVGLARQIIAKKLSVRAAENLVKKEKEPAKEKAAPRKVEKDADTRALEGDLSATLKMDVSIEHDGGTDGGYLKIKYKDLEQLDFLCQKITGV